MKLALAQFTAGVDKAKNLEGIIHWIKAAAAQNVELIMFPEYAMYSPDESTPQIREEAEPLDGPFVSAIQAEAKKHNIHVVCNFFETSDSSRPYNTSFAIDNQGEIMGTYRKVHMYNAFGYSESDNLRASDDPQPLIITVGDINVGVLICYDLRFPEWARAYIDRGADLLLYSAGWPVGPRKEDHWKTMLRSRAIENTAYVAGVVQGPPIAIGGTILVDPMGHIEGELSDQDGLIIREISKSRVEHIRRVNPSLQNRVFMSNI